MEINRILGECETTKLVNSKTDKSEYRLLRQSGQKGIVARIPTRNRLISLPGFEWGDNHDEAEQAVEPVPLHGKAVVNS